MRTGERESDHVYRQSKLTKIFSFFVLVGENVPTRTWFLELHGISQNLSMYIG